MFQTPFEIHRPGGDAAHEHDAGATSPRGDLPFYLEPAHRVHDPVSDPTSLFPHDGGANSALILPSGDSLPTDVPDADLWSNLAAMPFGHRAITPLDAQLHLTGHDTAMLRSFDDLRTQLLSAMQHNGWSRIAVTAPTTGCGASFTALNLALAIARIPDARAILMDLNLRAPAIARMLGMSSPGDMSQPLSGLTDMASHLVRASNTLALGLGRGCPQNPSDILHARRTAAVLKAMTSALRPDIMLYDLPAMLEHDDLEAVLPQVDGVLLVADATRTLASQISECEKRLSGKTNLLGIILNRTRSKRRQRARAA